MKKIEQFIRENRPYFDEDQPPIGHKKRFYRKLIERRESGRSRRGFQILKIAAVVVVFITTGVFSTIYFLRHREVAVEVEEIEFNEIKSYYLHEISERIEEIKSIKIISQPDINNLIIKEIDQTDELYKELERYYQKTPYSERVIEAMLVYYQTKLEDLERIIKTLRQIEEKDNKLHKNKTL